MLLHTFFFFLQNAVGSVARFDDDLRKVANLLSKTSLEIEMDCIYPCDDMCYNHKKTFDNIHKISIQWDIDSDNTFSNGWFFNANWKNLNSLSVREGLNFEGRLDANFQDESDTWKLSLPNLTSASISLERTPFPYCSLISLLFESPNLIQLLIKLELPYAVVENFDKSDFSARLKNHQFKLEHLAFVNSNGRWPKSIIPFPSLKKLIEASPKLESLDATLNAKEEEALKLKYGLRNENAEEYI